MMQIAHCFSCGESHVPLGGVMVTVQLSSPLHCGQCHTQKQRSIDLYFCSPAHMIEYMKAHGDVLTARAEEMAKSGSDWPYRVVDDVFHNIIAEVPKAPSKYKPLVLGDLDADE